MPAATVPGDGRHEGCLIVLLGLEPCGGAGPAILLPAQPTLTCQLWGCMMACETGNRLWRAWKCLQWKNMVRVTLASSVVSLGRCFEVVEQAVRAGWSLIWQGAAAAAVAGCARANSQGSCWEWCILLFARFLAQRCLLFAPP